MGKLETPEGSVQPVARRLGDLLVVGPIRNHWPLVFLTFYLLLALVEDEQFFWFFTKPWVTGTAGFQSTWTLVGGGTVRNHWPLVFTLLPYGNKTCNRQNWTKFFHFFLPWVTGAAGSQTAWTLCQWWGTHTNSLANYIPVYYLFTFYFN